LEHCIVDKIEDLLDKKLGIKALVIFWSIKFEQMAMNFRIRQIKS